MTETTKAESRRKRPAKASAQLRVSCLKQWLFDLQHGKLRNHLQEMKKPDYVIVQEHTSVVNNN